MFNKISKFVLIFFIATLALSCKVGFKNELPSDQEEFFDPALVSHWKDIKSDNYMHIKNDGKQYIVEGMDDGEAYYFIFSISKIGKNKFINIKQNTVIIYSLKNNKVIYNDVGKQDTFGYVKYLYSDNRLRITPINLDIFQDDVEGGLVEADVEYTCMLEPKRKSKDVIVLENNKNTKYTDCPIFDVKDREIKKYINKNIERLFSVSSSKLFVKVGEIKE